MLHYFHNLTFATFATFATLTFSIHLHISKKVVPLQRKLKDRLMTVRPLTLLDRLTTVRPRFALKDRLTTVRPLTLKDPLRTPLSPPKLTPKIRDFRGPRKGGE